MNPRTASDALTAAISFLWYAAPDLMPDRTSRIAARTALLVGGTTAVLVIERDELTQAAALPTGEQVAEPSDRPTEAPSNAEVTGGIAAVVASGLVVDQLMRRLSRRRVAQGRRFAHLPSAVIAAGYTLAVTPWMRRIEARLAPAAD